jgi:hypothetical protein
MTSPVLAWRESGTEGIRPNKNLRAVEASAIQNPSEHSSLLFWGPVEEPHRSGLFYF